MRLLPATALAVLVAAAGCGRKAEPAQGPKKGGAGAPSEYELRVGELVGYLRFTKNEYEAAVRDGQVVDKQEFDEATLMGLKPAERAWKALSAEVASKDAAAAKAVEEGIAELRRLVDAKADPVKVGAVVVAMSKALEGQLAGGVPPAMRATVASAQAADADIKGELVADDYRLGFVAFAPRAIGRYGAEGAWTVEKPDGATHLVGIVLREKGSKRPLPSSKVTVDFGRGPVALRPVWGDYVFYGANLALPEGAFTMKVEVDAPPICRHGDAMGIYLQPGRAEFKVTRHGGEITVDAPRPAPVFEGYRIGCDVEQALAESLEVQESGDFRIGFIAEAPEPIWCWEKNALEIRAAKDDDTHHLEIALLERGTSRIVMGAKVTLEMKHRETGAVQTIVMHNLLSEFAHYGNTVKLAPGGYTVTVKVLPPSYGLFEEGKFRAPATATIEWGGKAGEK